MKRNLIHNCLSLLIATAAFLGVVGSLAAQTKKPNILFIMGDDIGWMQPSIYHQGLMVGETPNIDRIGHEGAKFMTYYAEQSCTAGRTAFFTGMTPLRAGMIPPQLPGSPSYLRPGTPAIAQVPARSRLQPPASSARIIWATIPMPCPQRTASRSSGVTFITWTPCKG
jgi:arylsulfatase